MNNFAAINTGNIDSIYNEVIVSWLSASTAVRRWFASAMTPDPFNPKEPSGPSMKTAVPGPKSQELMRRLDGMQVS